MRRKALGWLGAATDAGVVEENWDDAVCVVVGHLVADEVAELAGPAKPSGDDAGKRANVSWMCAT